MQFSKLLGVTVLAMASSAQAQDPCTDKYAGYMPRTDASAYWLKDLEQKAFEDLMANESCPAVDDAKDDWDNPSPGIMSGYLQTIPTYTAQKSREWKEYTKYYGDNEQFHIDWVNAAFTCASTAGFTGPSAAFDPDFNTAYCNGSGDPSLNTNPLQVDAGKECVGIEESVKKATSYVYGFIEMVQLMAGAIKVSKDAGCNMQKAMTTGSASCTEAMKLWDGAAAIFTGSLEGEEGALPIGAGSGRQYGKTLYTLGEKRCRNFNTCGPLDGDIGDPERYDTASINSKIMQFFAAGSHAIYSGDRRRANYFKRKISAKVMVPWVQGTLRYAHRLSTSRDDQTASPTTTPTGGAPTMAPKNYDPSETHKEIAEASTFALGALPKLWACSEPANNRVAPLLRTGRAFGIGNEIDFLVVKTAFECNYRCLGITCEEVGALSDGDANVKPNAEACDDQKNLSGAKEVSKCSKPNKAYNKKCRLDVGPSGIGGRTNREYNNVDLDKN